MNITIEKIRIKFGLPKLKLAPYHFKMVDQSMTKFLRIIKKIEDSLTWYSTYRCTPKFLDRLNCESKGENNGRTRNWGTLPSSWHFKGKGA